MKRVIIGGALVTAALVAVVAWASGSVSAQDARLRLADPQVHIVSGSGSSIGVTVREVTADDAAKGKLDGARGVWLETVQDTTPASRAGLRAGDIVVEFDGERVRGVQQFARLVRETPSGRNVTMAIMRDGARQTVTVTPEDRSARTIDDFITLRSERGADRLSRPFSFDFDFPPEVRTLINPRQLGATLTPLSDQLQGYFGVDHGLLVSSVESGSPAEAAGVRAGDVVTSVNGRRVDALNDITQAIRDVSPSGELEITVTRDRKELALKGKLPERPAALRRRGVAL